MPARADEAVGQSGPVGPGHHHPVTGTGVRKVAPGVARRRRAGDDPPRALVETTANPNRADRGEARRAGPAAATGPAAARGHAPAGGATIPAGLLPVMAR